MHACQNNVKNIGSEQEDSIAQNEPTADRIIKRLIEEENDQQRRELASYRSRRYSSKKRLNALKSQIINSRGITHISTSCNNKSKNHVSWWPEYPQILIFRLLCVWIFCDAGKSGISFAILIWTRCTNRHPW